MVHIVRSHKTLKSGQEVTYLYIAHNVKRNGQTVKEWMIPLGRKEQAEKKLRDIALYQKDFHPESAEHLTSALLCAYLDIFDELKLVRKINDFTCKERAQGVTPGEYLLFCALHRLTEPGSKNQLKEWFEGTMLKEIYSEASQFLTVQNIWNHFKTYFTPDVLKEIYVSLVRTVMTQRGVSLNKILMDSTNFYTYISDHPSNELPKKGHSKDGKKHLNLVNFSLSLDEEHAYPLYYRTYPGNINDPEAFKEILPELSAWFEQLEADCSALTLIFDKGNNSEPSIRYIEEKGWGFIGSLRPSMFKELLQEPYTEFTKIYDTSKKHSIYAFRREAKVYTDTPKTIIVTFDEKVHNKNLHTFQYHIAKRFDQLREFSIHKLNTKPQWCDPEGILKHVDTQILKHKEFKTIIPILLERVIKDAIEYQELRWGLEEKTFTEKVHTYGKSIIFSNKRDWTTKDIVLAYRQLYKIEHKFIEMKTCLKTRPFYHRKDDPIRIHLFICLLALLGRTLLKEKLNTLKIPGRFSKNVNSLKKIHKVNLIYNKGKYKKSILPHLTKMQEKLVSQLHLERYFS